MSGDNSNSDVKIFINEPNIYDENHTSYFEITNKRPKIKDLDDNEKPMEKLQFRGAQALTDVELLAILIGSGTKEASALEVAYQVIQKIGNYELLMEASVEELMEVKGIGLTKASRIISGLELGKRINTRDSIRKYQICSPDDICKLYEARFRYENVEHFFVVLLDTKNFIVGEVEVSLGDLNKTIVNPREVFKVAIKRSSNAIMLIHNHPSGDPSPSKGDIIVTDRLIEAGKILGIPVMDHIILGYKKYYSFKRENLI